MNQREKELLCEPVRVADWTMTGPQFYERHVEGIEDFAYMPLDAARRAAECWNACRGIVNPVEALAELRSLSRECE